MAVMRCMVATPTRALFEGEITYAGIPGADGAYGVLPGHELMLSLNRQGGVLTLDLGENGQDRREFLIMGGATQVFNDKVTVLARYGTAVEDIDEAAVRAEADAARSLRTSTSGTTRRIRPPSRPTARCWSGARRS